MQLQTILEPTLIEPNNANPIKLFVHFIYLLSFANIWATFVERLRPNLHLMKNRGGRGKFNIFEINQRLDLLVNQESTWNDGIR